VTGPPRISKILLNQPGRAYVCVVSERKGLVMDSAFNDSVSGRVALDLSAGERLIATMSEQLDRVDQWLRRARGLARSLPFGNNPVGTAMAEKFRGRADGEDGSMFAVLEAYRNVLERAHDAARRAMRLYGEGETQHANNFSGILR
jgi:hypothetical protein